MIDAEYFRTQLPRQIEAAPAAPIVEVFLRSGHSQRIRNVVEAAPGYVVLEAFHVTGSRSSETSHWQAPVDPHAAEPTTFRVTVAYESIVQVIVDAAPVSAERRGGSFGFTTRPAS